MGAAAHASPALPTSDRLLVGVGDRLTMHAGGRSVFLPDEARRLGVGTDLFQIWLREARNAAIAAQEQQMALAQQADTAKTLADTPTGGDTALAAVSGGGV